MPPDVSASINDSAFWEEVAALNTLLLHFTKYLTAAQSSHSTLADATRHWLYLAQALKDLSSLSLPAGAMLRKLFLCSLGEASTDLFRYP